MATNRMQSESDELTVRATVTGDGVAVERACGGPERHFDAIVIRDPAFGDGGCVYGEPGTTGEAGEFVWDVETNRSVADHCHMRVVHDVTRTFQIDRVYRMDRHDYELGEMVENGWLALVTATGVDVLLDDRSRDLAVM